MDSWADTPIILTATHAQQTAQGIVDFLAATLSLKTLRTGTDTIISPDSDQIVNIYYPTYTGPKTTLSAAMTALGLDASYAHRKLIAKANNIEGYVGTAVQNTQMYNLLAAGILKKE